MHPRHLLRAATTWMAAMALMIPLTTRADPLLTYALRIKGHAVRAEVANDEDSRRTGLMFRERLGENSGMLFVYEAPGLHAMWMRNTLIPLSVAFLDKRGRIINIEDMEPQTEDSHAAAAPAYYSLEMNQGWFKKNGIKPGDRVEGIDKIPHTAGQ
jgi:uncharacterized membrane protein (UPF0127 family)